MGKKPSLQEKIQAESKTINAYEAYINGMTKEFLQEETNSIYEKLLENTRPEARGEGVMLGLIYTLVKKGTLRLEDLK